jgi:hypothetical protein
MLTEQIAVISLVTDALEALGITYAIGGSFASAVHGVMRATMDADLMVDLRLDQAEPFAQAMGANFYADLEMMRGAIRQRSSFNLFTWTPCSRWTCLWPESVISTAPSWPGANCTC